MAISSKKFFDKTFFIIVLSNVFVFYLYHFSSMVNLPWDVILNNSNYIFMVGRLGKLYYFFQFFAPLYAGLSAILFLTVRKNSFPFQAGRERSYSKLLIKNILRQSLKVAIACFVSFLVIFLVSYLGGTERAEQDIAMYRELGISPREQVTTFLLDILGEDFYLDHYVLFDFLLHTVQYFYAPFLYAILGSCFSFLFEKKYQVFLVTVLYYYGLTLFLNRLGHASFVPEEIARILSYLEPARVTMPASIHHVSTPLFFLASIVPALTPSAIILYRQLNKVKDRI